MQFRCSPSLKKAIIRDAKKNNVTVSDLMRERMSASLSMPYADAAPSGFASAVNEIDPRLSDPQVIDSLIKGASAALIWLDLNTENIENDVDVIYDRIATELESSKI